MATLLEDIEYRNTLQSLFRTFGASINKPEKQYGILLPHVGQNYSSTKLMICGRAGNGGNRPASQEYLKKEPRKLLERRVNEITMDWMVEHRSSPFINVARDILVSGYGLNEDNWYDHFAWTNLYKISPFSGGNPGAKERSLQYLKSLELLKMEIEFLTPRNLVLITDFDWAFDFIEYLGIDASNRGISGSFKYIKAKYQYGDTNIIVANRPEYRIRSKYVESVVKRLKNE